MQSISIRSGAATVLLLLALFLLAMPAVSAQPPGLLDEFQKAISQVEDQLERGYGYCGSRTVGEAAAVQVAQGEGAASYLLLQPLACGDIVVGVASVSGGKRQVQVATREDAIASLQRMSGVEPRRQEPDDGFEASAYVADESIAAVEGAITKATQRMGSLVTVQAIRVRVDTTYSSPAKGASLYYAKVKGELRLYVMVGELLGSTKSGKPYVDVYLRGFDTAGGTIMDDGAPRSKLIKSRPWTQLKDPPDEKEYREEVKKEKKVDPLKPRAAQIEEFRQVALAAIASEQPEAGIDSADRIVIAAIDAAEDGGYHVYTMASRADPEEGGIALIVCRIATSESGDEAKLDRVLEANPRYVAMAVETLQESEPPAPEPDEEEDEEKEVTYPSGSDESAEKAMRDMALSMFNDDPGLRGMLRVLAGLGGQTSKSHAITVGRVARSATVGTYSFLVTRTVPKIHKDSLGVWSIIEDSYMTYARVYEFPFKGGKPRQRSAKKEMSKLIGRQNVE